MPEPTLTLPDIPARTIWRWCDETHERRRAVVDEYDALMGPHDNTLAPGFDWIEEAARRVYQRGHP